MNAVRIKIKQVSSPRARLPLPAEDIVKELNPVLRGWGAYFRGIGTSRQMTQIDRYVIRRLALFMRKKHHRPAMHWARCNNLDWQRRVGLYRLAGCITATAPP